MESTHWPLFGLVLRTPRLELRLPSLSELDELAGLAGQGVHDPAEMPFGVAWTDEPPEEIPANVMQFHWSLLAAWSPQDWVLPLVVFRAGRPAGVQDVRGARFAITREVSSGSWLGRRYQGQGLGTEMRAAVLHLAFAGLGAESATSGAHTDNPASRAVSRKLGYQDNGVTRTVVRDTLVFEEQYVLSRDRWRRHSTIPVELAGLEPCLPMFGLAT